MRAIKFAEESLLPDAIIRQGIKRLLRQRIQRDIPSEIEEIERAKNAFVQKMKASSVAVKQDLANQQHYEVDSRFYEKVLGPYLKYSCGSWDKASNLKDSEREMLDLVCSRAEIQTAKRILDLGCGWGSFSLFAAERFPDKTFVAVSNSRTQKDFIDQRARDIGLKNLTTYTLDASRLDWDEKFDRIVSVEMFEHMRNYEELLGNLARFLEPGGKLFVHIFCHRTSPYFFEAQDDSDWMAKYFFSGGLMPSFDLLFRFPRDLQVEESWAVSGMHYSKTSEAWLKNVDENRRELISLFTEIYGEEEAGIWLQRWRIFFMSCSELFRFRDGEEWFVGHYLLSSHS